MIVQRSIVITLPLPDRVLSPNARCHWATKSRAVKAARDEARQNADALREALTEAQSHAETRTAERGWDCFKEVQP